MKITSPLKYLSLLAIISLSTSFVHAESQAELKAKAKISEEAARETALKKVPGGTVERKAFSFIHSILKVQTK